MKRRQFVKNSAMAGIALTQPFSNIIVNRKNREYRTALIGSGWWGNNILGEAMREGSSRIVAVCDPDERYIRDTAARVEKETGHKPSQYLDYRELLDKEKPDIAIIASPEHWHALQAIDSLEAGCHIYLEKPIAHTINEGKAIVSAQKRTGKVVQVGLHRRTSPHCAHGQRMLKDGRVGDIKMIRACVYSDTVDTFIDPQPATPDYLHWDLYLGPARYQPYAPTIHPRGFRKFLNFTNGVIGDWGVHWMDQILWWSEEKYPKKIYSTADIVHPDCGYDSPDFQSAVFDFDSFVVNWEHRYLGGDRSEKHQVGTYFYGTKGVLHIGWIDGTTFYPESDNKAIIKIPHEMHLPDHQNIRELWMDFLQAIEGKKSPIAGIDSSHRATTMSLLAMISYKTGNQVLWDGEKEMIIDNPEASKHMYREYREPWEYPEV